MFSIYYISHHRLDKKRLEKNDKAKLIVQIVTFTMILLAAVSGFTFFDTARNTALNDYNVMSKFVLCATAVCEILFKIGAAQPNCHSMVSYLMLPIKKRDLFNSRTLIDCFQLYNFYCFVCCWCYLLYRCIRIRIHRLDGPQKYYSIIRTYC